MKGLALCLALALIAATGLSLLRISAWWVRGFDFPRPQIALLSSALLATYLTVWGVQSPTDVVTLFLLAACVTYQAVHMLPYTPLYPKQAKQAVDPDPEQTLSILTSNVYMENRDAQRLLRLVRSWAPDVILAVETDAWWEEQLRVIEKDYPFRLKHPLANTYGMLFYSRLELLEPKVEFLVADDLPSVHTDLRLLSGSSVRFHGLHPRPPAPTESSDTVERDGELLIVAKRVSEHPGPSIVIGDLNDVAWSATTSLMQRISGLLDPRIGRGLFCTFHAKIPLLRWPLDHVFHSSHFQVVTLKRLPAVGSDHFPVFVRLALSPEAAPAPEEPEPEPGDESRAKTLIEEALKN